MLRKLPLSFSASHHLIQTGNCKIPWHFHDILENIQFSLIQHKILWQFPDLKKNKISLTFPRPVWTLWYHCLKRLNISQKYHDLGLNNYGKMSISKFFPYKCIRNQIWPCHKAGQGQARFIICGNLIETTALMLHTKSQGPWPIVPENKIFKGFLPYMGVVVLTFETYL